MSREALLALAKLGGLDDNMRFGTRKMVEPVNFLISTAAGWGGNPREAAIYIGNALTRNDGKIVHRMTLKNVPVDGFWSVSLYNGAGFFEKNSLDAYSINNISAVTTTDGSATFILSQLQIGTRADFILHATR